MIVHFCEPSGIAHLLQNLIFDDQLRVFGFLVLLSCKFLITFFNANIYWVPGRLTAKTSPKEPDPIFGPSIYFEATLVVFIPTIL